jgi:pectin methylesterase-like acyl-CoA thioesterase
MMRLFALLACALLACASPAFAKAVSLSVGATGGADYRTVQAAVDALPDSGGTIRIAPGRYREKLHIFKSGVHLRGTGKRPQDVVLVYGDSSKTAGGTFKSATLDASGDDFRLTNLTVQNDWGVDPANPPSQAVALALTGDRAVIDRVRLLGHQDTLYANRGRNKRPARQYFRDCYIEGHVDFIFGDANAYFNRCHLHGVAHESVMFTAQSRNAPDDDSAYVFNNCRITADPAAGEISLGRAWRPYARVLFLNTRMDAPIIMAGWREWTPGKTDTLSTAYYAEYRSTGPGASPSTREPRSHQLTAAQAREWTLPAFFKGDIAWTR